MPLEKGHDQVGFPAVPARPTLRTNRTAAHAWQLAGIRTCVGKRTESRPFHEEDVPAPIQELWSSEKNFEEILL